LEKRGHLLYESLEWCPPAAWVFGRPLGQNFDYEISAYRPIELPSNLTLKTYSGFLVFCERPLTAAIASAGAFLRSIAPKETQSVSAVPTYSQSINGLSIKDDSVLIELAPTRDVIFLEIDPIDLTGALTNTVVEGVLDECWATPNGQSVLLKRWLAILIRDLNEIQITPTSGCQNYKYKTSLTNTL